MRRVVIVSNRLPLTIENKNGTIKYKHSVGGLATGLSCLQDREKLWIGWVGKSVDDEKQRKIITDELKLQSLVPVYLTKEEISRYYYGFSNKTLWPQFHYFTQYTQYNEEFWESYKEINQKFADVVFQHVNENDDMIWVHDYQLMLLPNIIRSTLPNAAIGFFLHIPFPSYETFRYLPWRKELLEGVLAADTIGFHTSGYLRHFLSAVYRLCGYENTLNRLQIGDRYIHVDVFPMSIDYNKYASFKSINDDSDWSLKNFKAAGLKTVLSIDRLDYTKGIPSRIRAFERFFTAYPEYIEKVVFVMIVVPCRCEVEQYKELKEEIETLTGKMNGNYTTFSWSPVYYITRGLAFEELCPMYREADVCLITPIRDGMNLVAKEYIAAKHNCETGVLILSEMAGAADELSDSIIVNPNDESDIVEAIKKALEMPVEEQTVKLRKMQSIIKNYTVQHWAETFINCLQDVIELSRDNLTFQVNARVLFSIISQYASAKHRLLIFDYDRTLMPFNKDPSVAQPDSFILKLLSQLSEDARNKIVITSARDKELLEKCVGYLHKVDLAPEYGICKRIGGKWISNVDFVFNSWKDVVRSLISLMQARTPGTFIEEKTHSLVWHFKGLSNDAIEAKIREIRYELMYLVGNLDLQVIEGSKFLEIRTAGMSKGNAALYWINMNTKWDFILALGDDATDEATFRTVNNYGSSCYTIRLGLGSTAARYSVLSVEGVRSILRHLVSH